MSYFKLDSYQEFTSLPIKHRWTKCTVGLEHSVSGKHYWLLCEIQFFVDDEADLYLHIGPGSKGDANLVINTLEAHGFVQTGRRFMREWEYFDYQRADSRKKSTQKP